METHTQVNIWEISLLFRKNSNGSPAVSHKHRHSSLSLPAALLGWSRYECHKFLWCFSLSAHVCPWRFSFIEVKLIHEGLPKSQPDCCTTLQDVSPLTQVGIMVKKQAVSCLYASGRQNMHFSLLWESWCILALLLLKCSTNKNDWVIDLCLPIKNSGELYYKKGNNS